MRDDCGDSSVAYTTPNAHLTKIYKETGRVSSAWKFLPCSKEVECMQQEHAPRTAL